ncbi:hypothetical protein Tco_0631087 [Tanacetum coccineum]
MSLLNRLTIFANSLLVKDMMIKLFEIDNERDFRTVRETYAMCQQLIVRCQERREQMLETQIFLHVSIVLAESYKLLKELQDYELEKCTELMKSISETQLKVVKKISFIAKLRRQCSSGEVVMERLPIILEGAKVFDKKGIHPSDYSISFKLADNVLI